MINWDRISELQDEVGEDGIVEVVEIFVEEMEEGLNGLSDLSDPTAIMERLHFLKGSAQNIGLDEMSALCASDENAIRSNAIARPDAAAIQSALERARSELEALSS